MSNSSAVAQQIARSLVAAGVREVVLSPGSRSAPLVYAFAPLAEAGVIRTHVRLDERDAGFLALGLARGLRVRGAGSAVALVTTSGSAVANLHPAVLEASYGHLPLIAITADRPARLRGTGANQTIDDQVQVLSDVRARYDVPAEVDAITEVDSIAAEAVALALGAVDGRSPAGALPGPVQLNVQFDTPLVPTEDELAAWQIDVAALATEPVSGSSLRASSSPRSAESDADPITLPLTPGAVIVAGDAGGWPAESLSRFARDHGVPVLAEPSSPLARRANGEVNDHERDVVVPAHSRVLAERPDLRERIDTVIVHGKPTLTRPVAALLADPDVSVYRLPDDIDAHTLLAAEADSGESASASAGWSREWVEAGEALLRPASSCTSDPEALARSVAARLAVEDITLFAASSNSIRYLNEVPEIRADVHASRGLAGIDGLVSTATGFSLALGRQVVLLIGDVALLHDVGGLLTPSREEAGDVVIVVLNDDGGAIFGGLEHSQEHVVGQLERYFGVPHGRTFGELAAAYGWDYAKVSTLEEFIAEFARTQESPSTASSSGTPSTPSSGRRVIIEVDLSHR